MGEYDVGYGKPPKHSRFKIGNKASSGRPKRKALAAVDLINAALHGMAQFMEGGRTKKATRLELGIKKTVNDALNGDVKAAETVLKLLAHPKLFGDAATQRILMRHWFPDHAGQTGEQKTRQFATKGEADPPAWWKPPEINPGGDQ
jgi:Family of unknown function (DUF5681)